MKALSWCLHEDTNVCVIFVRASACAFLKSWCLCKTFQLALVQKDQLQLGLSQICQLCRRASVSRNQGVCAPIDKRCSTSDSKVLRPTMTSSSSEAAAAAAASCSTKVDEEADVKRKRKKRKMKSAFRPILELTETRDRWAGGGRRIGGCGGGGGIGGIPLSLPSASLPPSSCFRNRLFAFSSCRRRRRRRCNVRVPPPQAQTKLQLSLFLSG